ncbi:unnamed protein product [Cunninghamella blakesleeana]
MLKNLISKRSFHTHSKLYERHKQRHYDILQIKRTSDKKAIKTQYYRLSKKYHPDLNANDKEAHQKFIQVNEAYAVLGNEASRRLYDAELDSSPSSPVSSSVVGQASAAYYGASRKGYSGPSVAWRARARKASKNTGSASAKEQADQYNNNDNNSPHFNHQEHYTKHYESEEIRRRERVKNAAKRRQEAGLDDDEDGTTVDHFGNKKKKLNIWARLWRLGILLAGITYATRKFNDHEDEQKKKNISYVLK